MSGTKETYKTICEKYNIRRSDFQDRQSIFVTLSDDYFIRFDKNRIEFTKTYIDDRYYLTKKFHRIDGPAVISSFGNCDWIINGKPITKLITIWAKENGINLNRLTDDDKIMIKLFWADYE